MLTKEVDVKVLNALEAVSKIVQCGADQFSGAAALNGQLAIFLVVYHAVQGDSFKQLITADIGDTISGNSDKYFKTS